MPFQFRQYQSDCIRRVKLRFDDGITAQLIVLPTGTGKTVVITGTIQKFDWPTVVLVHRDELIKQTVDKLKKAGCSDIGVIQADQNDIHAKIIVASVQTLSRNHRLRELVTRPGESIKLVIVDEAHHTASSSYIKIIQAIDPVLLLGFTATPIRLDGKSLIGPIFQEIAYKKNILEMVVAGFLTIPKRKMVNTGVDLRNVRIRGGDYNPQDLARVLNISERHKRIVDAYVPGRKTIVFAVDIDNAKAIAQEFRNRGILTAVIHSKMSKMDRATYLYEYEQGHIQVLVNCSILTEGFDDPETDCVLIARPTLSIALYIQMIGRALRLFPGKEDALIIDVTDNSLRHSIGLPDVIPEYRSGENEEQREIPQADLEFFNNTDDEGNPLKLKKKERGNDGWYTGENVEYDEFGVFHNRNLRWVKMGEDGYSLNIGKNQYLALIKGSVSQKFLIVSGQREYLSEWPMPPEYAFGIAEEWAMNKAKQLGLKRPAGWVEYDWHKEYPTDKQFDFAKKLGIPEPKGRISKADLGYMIDERILRSKFYGLLNWVENNYEMPERGENVMGREFANG